MTPLPATEFELEPDQLHRLCDPDTLGFETTDEVDPLHDALGQADAMAALDFGLSASASGYNIYIAGPPGSGRRSFVLQALSARAADEPTPPDWCYVFNFEEVRRPLALRFPDGRGPAFREDMHRLVEDLRRAIPDALQSENVVARRSALIQEREKPAAEAMEALRRELDEDPHVALVGEGEGFMVAPARGGEALGRSAYLQLSDELRANIDARLREANVKVASTQRKVHELQREARDRVAELNREVGRGVVAQRIAALQERYGDLPRVLEHLERVAGDMAEKAERFAGVDQHQRDEAPAMLLAVEQEDLFRRYAVNCIVHHESDSGAPIAEETDPNLSTLTGRLERRMRFGAMVTDFSNIVAGTLHRADGGYLLVEVQELLSRPLAWPALKRVLRTGEVRPVEMAGELGLLVTESLEPEPIPVGFKVVLIGEAALFQMLHALDPDFHELFKVKADFRPRMEREPETEAAFAAFIAGYCRNESLPRFDAPAVASIIEESTRMAGDQRKFTTQFSEVADLLCEAAHWARTSGRDTVGRQDVSRAIDERERRNNRGHRDLLDLIERQVLTFDPKGQRAGQLYGIGLAPLGDGAIGRPIPVMASAFMGTGGVIHIEREAKLSGRIHSKGFLILSGYLGTRFARNRPLVLSASLSFEQLYEEVEGDSASVAELYALLSAIGEIPLRQGIAVTGAISQTGMVLPVGGVTQKVEGFFAACERAGLSGEQGVLLPRRNLDNLVLRPAVRTAVAEGRFHLYAIDRVEDGWPILSDRPAGQAGPDGTYPADSVHGAVMRRLDGWAEQLQEFGARESRIRSE